MPFLDVLTRPTLSDDLRIVSGAIADAGKELAKHDRELARDLDLAGHAARTARNLQDLKGHAAPAIVEAGRKEFDAIATRIVWHGPGDPHLVADAKELQLLAARTSVALKESPRNQEALREAREDFAVTVASLAKQGDSLTAKDLKAWLDGRGPEGSARALDAMREHPDKAVRDVSAEATRDIAREALAQQQAAGPSLAPRDAARAPNDVLVHVMTVVNDALKMHADDKGLQQVAEQGRRMFMSHEVDTPGVRELIVETRKALIGAGELQAAQACNQLRSQLAPDGALTHAQLTDNLYGRVFDTKLVASLVQNPPEELRIASGRTGAAFAATLQEGNARHEEAAKYFVDHYVVQDQRPWSASVPAFAEMAKAQDGPAALKAVKDFMQATPGTGHEIVAMSYMLAKMPQAQANTGEKPEWFVEATNNYQRITREANRDRAAPADEKVVSQAAGITMLHQPEATGIDNLVPSERPGTANRMVNRHSAQNKTKHELGDMAKSTQNEVQLEHALPFASGVSGTTNLLVHLYDRLEKTSPEGTGVKPQEFLVNSMMFLVHDGGHSMHEAMWTANQIQTELGDKVKFEVGLSDTHAAGLEAPARAEAVNRFVSNYDRLIDRFPEGSNLKTAMQAAQGEAWKGTQDYLKEHSAFAQPGHEQAVVVKIAPKAAHEPPAAAVHQSHSPRR